MGLGIHLAVGAGISMVGILPGLRDGSIVPDVTMVRETVGNIPR